MLFVTKKNIIVSSITFPHKKKGTWKVIKEPDDETINQIDHALIHKRFRLCIIKVRSYRGADSDKNYFPLVAKCKLI